MRHRALEPRKVRGKLWCNAAKSVPPSLLRMFALRPRPAIGNYESYIRNQFSASALESKNTELSVWSVQSKYEEMQHITGVWKPLCQLETNVLAGF